jgi:hypothetical protein
VFSRTLFMVLRCIGQDIDEIAVRAGSRPAVGLTTVTALPNVA